MAKQTEKQVKPDLEPLILEGPGPFAFIGDIHGCYEELMDLDEIINLRYPGVQFISLGDLVDRGPNVHEVVDHCRKNNYHLILGNHDEKILRWAKGNPVKLKEHHQATINVLTEQDIEYLRTGHWFVRVPHYRLIGVHGGFWPDLLPEWHDPKQIIRMSDIDIVKKKLCKHGESDDKIHWSNLWDGPEQIIYGHTASKMVRLNEKGWTVGIDTGCVYGNKLTGFVVFTDEKGNKNFKFHQVKARKKYWEYHGGELS